MTLYIKNQLKSNVLKKIIINSNSIIKISVNSSGKKLDVRLGVPAKSVANPDLGRDELLKIVILHPKKPEEEPFKEKLFLY